MIVSVKDFFLFSIVCMGLQSILGLACSAFEQQSLQVSDVFKIENSRFDIFWPSGQSFLKGGQIAVKRCTADKLFTVAYGNVVGTHGKHHYASVRPLITAMPFNSLYLNHLQANLGNNYWIPMVGDRIEFIRTEIVDVPNVNRVWTGDVSTLFETPFKNYELSNQGRKILIDIFESVFSENSGHLLVEGFVNKSGPREQNLQYGLLWSQAVAQFFRMHYDLPFDKVVPLSIGNDNFSLDKNFSLKGVGGVRIYTVP